MKDGKIPFEYLVLSVLEGDAQVHKGGGDKYGKNNWTIDEILASTYVGAMFRHLIAWAKGINIDPDSGYNHLYHLRACCAVVLDGDKHGKLIDDRLFAESKSQENECATESTTGQWNPPRMPRAPRSPAEVYGKMTMADYHDLSDAWFDGKSDCTIRTPRDAGVGRKYIVQFTDWLSDVNFVHVVVSDGPFESLGAAEVYARENPNKRPGLASICSLNPQEE